ncbi:MAG TPA: SDR family NAD(P)-dependent oxidoreductase [Candidatus Binataceae bacterium]
MKGLENKVALVTAAAGGGIGKATARRLAAEGAIVVVTDSHERRTAETVAELAAEFGPRIAGFPLDVGSRERIGQVVGDVLARYEKIDVLVNNAGINVLGALADISPEDWTRVIEIDLTGPYNMIRAILPGMRQRRSGAIVNVSSIAAWSVMGGGDGPYAAAKAGLLALTRTVAAEAGPDGVRCNAVAPGVVRTRFVEKYIDRLESLAKGTPLRRLGTPEDVAALIAFLASDDASFITGEVVTVSGGLYMHA